MDALSVGFVSDQTESQLAITLSESSGGLRYHALYRSPKSRETWEQTLAGALAAPDEVTLHYLLEPKDCFCVLHAAAPAKWLNDPGQAWADLERNGVNRRTHLLGLFDAATGEPFVGKGAVLAVAVLRERVQQIGRMLDNTEVSMDRRNILAALPAHLGSLVPLARFQGLDGAVALVDVRDAGCDVWVMDDGGLRAHRQTASGLQALVVRLQTDLGLKFPGSAAKLVYEGLYDFSTAAEGLTAELAEAVQAALAEIEAQIKQPVRSIAFTQLPPSSDWLARATALHLKRELVRWPSPQGDAKAADGSLALPEFCLSPAIAAGLARLERRSETAWQWYLEDEENGFLVPSTMPEGARGLTRASFVTIASEPTAAELAQRDQEEAEAATVAAVITPAPATPAPKADKKPEPKAEKKPEPKAEAKAVPVAAPAAKPAPKAEAKPTPAPAAKPAPAPTPAPKPEEKKKGSPVPIIAAAALLLIIAGGGYVLFAPKGEPKPSQQQIAAQAAAEAAARRQAEEKAAQEKAAQEAAEAARLQAEQEAAEAARIAAEKEAAEAARLAAEQAEKARIEAQATLNISGLPEGTLIRLNNEALGEDSLNGYRLDPGSYTIALSHPDFEPYSQKLDLSAKQKVDVKAPKMVPYTGSVDLTANPLGTPTTYRITRLPAGTQVAEGSVPAAVDLPIGEYQVTFRRDGRSDQVHTVQIAKGAKQPVLAEYAATGVSLVTTPPGAVVSLNGKVVGSTPYTDRNLKPGKYTFTIDNRGFDSETWEVEVTEGNLASKQITLNDSNRIYKVSEVDVLPFPLYQPEPEYRVRGAEERCLVEFILNQDGQPTDITVISASNDRMRDPVMKAVSEWRFQPALAGERSVRMRLRLPIVLSGNRWNQ